MTQSEDVKEFFNHELDEKYCERYKIQKLSCEVEKDHAVLKKEIITFARILNGLKEKKIGKILEL